MKKLFVSILVALSSITVSAAEVNQALKSAISVYYADVTDQEVAQFDKEIIKPITDSNVYKLAVNEFDEIKQTLMQNYIIAEAQLDYWTNIRTLVVRTNITDNVDEQTEIVNILSEEVEKAYDKVNFFYSKLVKISKDEKFSQADEALYELIVNKLTSVKNMFGGKLNTAMIADVCTFYLSGLSKSSKFDYKSDNETYINNVLDRVFAKASIGSAGVELNVNKMTFNSAMDAAIYMKRIALLADPS